MTNTQEHLQDI